MADDPDLNSGSDVPAEGQGPKPTNPADHFKYTEKVRERIRTALETGTTRGAAAQAGGISKNTFYKWMKLFPEFEELVFSAEAAALHFAESQLWKNIKEGKGPDIRYYLSTRYPEDWGGGGTVFQQDLRVSGDGKISVISRISSLSDRELDDIIRGIRRSEEGQDGESVQ
jgi:hypothetical protein